MQNSDDKFIFLILWFILGFVTISLVSGKLFIYVLPLLTPLAIALGHKFKEYFYNPEHSRRSYRIESVIAAVLFFGMLAAAMPIANSQMDSAEFSLEYLLVISVVMFIIVVIFTIRLNKIAVFLSFIVGMFLFNAYMFIILAPVVDPLFSSKDAGEKIAELSSDGGRYATYKTTRGIFSFHIGSPIEELIYEEVPGYLEHSTENILLIRGRIYNEMIRDEHISKDVVTHGKYNIANVDYMIISNPVSDNRLLE